jgi:hypothetical protein
MRATTRIGTAPQPSGATSGTVAAVTPTEGSELVVSLVGLDMRVRRQPLVVARNGGLLQRSVPNSAAA